MSNIGSNHFLDPLDKLPGEEIVWEGGASWLGVAVQFIHTLAFIVLFSAIFLLPIGIASKLYIDNPNYVEPKHVSTKSGSSDQKKNNKAEHGAENKQTEPKVILNKRLVGQLLFIGISSLFVLGIASMWLRIKNYWFVVTNERICIQSGILTREVVTVDLDKIASVISSHSIMERLFKLHSVEIVHGGLHTVRAQQGLLLFNPYKIQYVPTQTGLASKLLNNWLPRDNRKRSS